MITAQLLGGACLRADDAPVGGPPAQRHRIALLTLIVGSWPKPLTRDRAMALLWPDRDAASARRLLNLAVHVLRSALGESVITSMNDALLFQPDAIRCDFHDLRTAIVAHDAERIVSLYTGTLLDGFHLGDSSEFGFWLDEQRRALAEAYVDALRKLAETQTKSGDARGTVRTCRRLVAADPYSALHAQALMRALEAAGDRAAAIQHAAEHAQRLRLDLELPPGPEVQALAARLRAAPNIAPVPNATGSRKGSTIAVLPFVNLSPDPENDYFADGITEDVIAQLAKIRALKVIARASVMPFKQRDRSLAQIANALGVSVLLDGSVRRAGDRVRIVAKLIDVKTDEHLWAETYDRELTDIFAIQAEVALHIAAALEAELTIDEQARVRRMPTRDLPAYQLFLKGRQRFIEYTPDSFHDAIEYFRQAIGRDASFALAWAHIGMAYTELTESGAIAPDVAHQRAAEATATALRLDPELSAAYCTLGHLKGVTELDWVGAERAFQRAIELSPSNADAHDLYGRLCGALERYDEAIALQTRAQELDPLAHRLDVITTLLRAGRYAQAVERGRDALALDRDYDRAHATLGWAYFLNGQKSEGLAELERAVSISPTSTLWLGQLGQAYAIAGETTKARDILRQLEDRGRAGFVSPYHLAYVYTGLGESDEAIRCLERAVAERTGPAYSIRGSFLLTSLHAHPRFQALLQRMGLS